MTLNDFRVEKGGANTKVFINGAELHQPERVESESVAGKDYHHVSMEFLATFTTGPASVTTPDAIGDIERVQDDIRKMAISVTNNKYDIGRVLDSHIEQNKHITAFEEDLCASLRRDIEGKLSILCVTQTCLFLFMVGLGAFLMWGYK